MATQRTISPKKTEEVNKIKELLNKYSIVGLARIEKVPAKAFHSLRNSLRKDVVIRVSKKRLVKIAFEESGKPKLKELVNQIQGITALLMTNMNPIKLAQYLESKAVKGPARPGDIAPEDIMVKEGDTKLAPGPIISELNQNLKVPTLIKNGTVHIRTDTITHKKGAIIDEKQAMLLSRLGIEPVVIKLDFYAAWENGELISAEVLHLDEGKILSDVRFAVSQGLNFAMSLGIITAETINPILSRAIREANALAIELPIFIPDILPIYISKAVRTAITVEAAALGKAIAAPAASAPAKGKKKEEEKKEEKRESDDEAMGGNIANLFG